MKTSTYIYKIILSAAIFMGYHTSSNAQLVKEKTFQRTPVDSTKKLNMDAVYNRPFLTTGGRVPIAIGGYVEANSQYVQKEGISDGLSFQARRMTLFFSSTITKNIKFLTEIEFEDGTREINIEFAAMDIEFNPLLNLRGGIVMNPIGAFNQNHDGPGWDFIDRPISATSIIPSTLSNVGFGIHGKHFSKGWTIGYEAYATNGFDDNIISNEDNRTSLAAGKSNPAKFEESNSGLPMFTGKLAVRNRRIGELGISYMSGVFNKYTEDDLELDDKRLASVAALDFNTSFFRDRLNLNGEVAKVFVDVPDTYTQQYGSRQIGAYLDIVGTVMQKKMFDWDKAKLNVGIRLEYADYNQGRFKETNGIIADDVWAIVPSIAFRPVGATVLRLNYRHMQERDLLGNPAEKTGAIQFGFSTYF